MLHCARVRICTTRESVAARRTDRKPAKVTFRQARFRRGDTRRVSLGYFSNYLLDLYTGVPYLPMLGLGVREPPQSLRGDLETTPVVNHVTPAKEFLSVSRRDCSQFMSVPQRSSAVTQNEKVFPILKQRLASRNIDEYLVTTNKLKSWLKSERAYYPAARPKVRTILCGFPLRRTQFVR